jgi:hypothetical protein
MVTTTFFTTVTVVQSTIPSSEGRCGRHTTVVAASAAAGGAVGLIIVFLLGFFLWRRKRGNFDGSFDPTRIVRDPGQMDLTGTEVTPYSYEPEAEGVASGYSGPSSPARSGDNMQQYRENQVSLDGNLLEAGVATGTSGSRYPNTLSDRTSPHPPPSVARSSSHGSSDAGLGLDFLVMRPYRPLSVKERRQRERASLVVSNQSAPDENEVEIPHHSDGGHTTMSMVISPPQVDADTPSREEGQLEVIQHLDGGQVIEPVEVDPPEIPPSYDSIPRNPV